MRQKGVVPDLLMPLLEWPNLCVHLLHAAGAGRILVPSLVGRTGHPLNDRPGGRHAVGPPVSVPALHQGGWVASTRLRVRSWLGGIISALSAPTLQVCLAIETCGHTRFSTIHDTWASYEPFHCGDALPGSPSFSERFIKVALTSTLWGLGTALGEIPPYLMSRSAALGRTSSSSCGAPDEPAAPSWFQRSLQRLVSWWAHYMVVLIKRGGFLGITLLASFPNAAFDLVGLCCGQILMPFWTFFPAVLLGKGLIRANTQVRIAQGRAEWC